MTRLATNANMAKWWSEGESHGPLVPQNDTSIRVDSEDLSFVVAPTLDRAEVTATYHLTNGGADTKADVAFVMVASENAARGSKMNPQEARASVTIDGATVDARLVTEVDILAPLLDQWLAAHPEIDRELARLEALPDRPSHRETEALAKQVPGCRGECDDLLRWHRLRKSEDADVLAAAREAIPEQVQGLQRGWSRHDWGGELSWLTFPLSIPAGASRTVVVHYTHHSGSDTSHAVNTVFTYEYLLSPAKRWAKFGELHVDIELPPNTDLRAPSLSFTPEGAHYRGNFTGVPSAELTFEVMSRQGLLFGMTQPTGYWILLLALMALVTVPTSSYLGRAVQRATRSRLRVVLICVFGISLLSLVWNGLLVAAISLIVPQRAFGYSYDSLFGFFAAFVLFTILATVSSLLGSRAK
jgi:hypothetical protein